MLDCRTTFGTRTYLIRVSALGTTSDAGHPERHLKQLWPCRSLQIRVECGITFGCGESLPWDALGGIFRFNGEDYVGSCSRTQRLWRLMMSQTDGV